MPEAAVRSRKKPRSAIRRVLHFGFWILDFGFLIGPVPSELSLKETTFPSIPNSEGFVIHRRGAEAAKIFVLFDHQDAKDSKSTKVLCWVSGQGSGPFVGRDGPWADGAPGRNATGSLVLSEKR